MLNFVKTNPELIDNSDMNLTIEVIRDGISQAVTRFLKVNNKYIKNYYQSKPEKYLLNVDDANNLYGGHYRKRYGRKCELIQYIRPLEEWTQEILEWRWRLGYTFKCDSECPKELHN